ncbi:MAG: Gfo/Idh/MocA family oxidoreductase, partial [Candidatus Goldbacteria bacterium]|nr:Gfo/Idh/MocA family oxidoreductase [Candidatus Goldiibacteriota bacterium]
MDRIIRAGVVGVGSLGQHHARIYANTPGVKLTCVADVADKCKEIADKYGASFFNDYKKIVNMVDVVSIAVPTSLHYKISKFFIENKKHILLEKPMTSTATEAKELLRLYKKHKVILQIGHIERFNVAIEKLQQLKKVPVLIEANRLGPFTARSTDISVVLDLMIHDIDIILQLVNSAVKKIDAIGVPILTDYIDMASARIEFKNGSVANITASRVSPKKIRKIRVFENNAYMSIDYIRQSIKVYKLKEGLSGDRKISWNDMMELEVYPMSKEEPLAKEIKAFIAAVRSEQKVEVTPEQAYEALKIVLEIEKQINKKLDKVRNKKV